ncbi:hypothetical protein OG754_30000 [Streptomyces decoyicus]|uniref:hypothetical protein n=1 Tax=Streptomyces decoyicus TaxID=249567 RepID=UPI002E36489D|nr:hypothetical protein [Streptomyces decoyicus]
MFHTAPPLAVARCLAPLPPPRLALPTARRPAVPRPPGTAGRPQSAPKATKPQVVALFVPVVSAESYG